MKKIFLLIGLLAIPSLLKAECFEINMSTCVGDFARGGDSETADRLIGNTSGYGLGVLQDNYVRIWISSGDSKSYEYRQSTPTRAGMVGIWYDGIGTFPDYHLDVAGIFRSTSSALLATSTGMVAIATIPSTNDWNTYWFMIGNGSFTATRAGAFGFGTASPSSMLEVRGGSVSINGTTAGLAINGYSIQTTSNVVLLDASSQTKTGSLFVQGYLASGTTAQSSKFEVANGSVSIWGGGTAGLNVGTGNFIVTQSGNVGIGEELPTRTLHLSRPSGVSTAIQLDLAANSGFIAMDKGAEFAQGTSGENDLVVRSPDDIFFSAAGVRMVLKAGGGNGTVGIGTTTPTSALDIFNGSATIRGTDAGLIVHSTPIANGFEVPSWSGGGYKFSDGTVQRTASTGGGGSGGGKNYYTIVIGTSSIGYNSSVDFAGTDQTVFNDAISSISVLGGSIFVRRGTYVFTNDVEVPYGVELVFEEGSVVANSGNVNLFSTSGTIRNLTIEPRGDWAWGYLLLANTSSYTENFTIKGGGIGGLVGLIETNQNAPVVLRGFNVHLEGYNVLNTTISGSIDAKRLTLFDNCTDCEIDSGRIIDASGATSLFDIKDSTRAKIQNMNISGNSLEYSIRWRGGSASSNTVIQNNIFTLDTNNASGQTIAMSKCNLCQFKSNVFIKKAAVGGGQAAIDISASGIASSGTIVTDNQFYNFTTGILIENNANNVYINGNYFTGVPTGINVSHASVVNTYIHGNFMTGATTAGVSDSGTHTLKRDNHINGVMATDD